MQKRGHGKPMFRMLHWLPAAFSINNQKQYLQCIYIYCLVKRFAPLPVGTHFYTPISSLWPVSSSFVVLPNPKAPVKTNERCDSRTFKLHSCNTRSFRTVYRTVTLPAWQPPEQQQQQQQPYYINFFQKLQKNSLCRNQHFQRLILPLRCCTLYCVCVEHAKECR